MSLSTLLDAVERRLSATLEAAPLRIFRARLEPIHVVRYLERWLDRGALVTTGAVIVPHDIRVRLNPTDHVRLMAAGNQLEHHIAARLERAVRSQGRTTLHPIIVRLESDVSVPLGQVRAEVMASSNVEPEDEPMMATSPLPVVARGSGTLRITLPGGEIALFTQTVVSIGRGAENDVVISDPQVSRYHAEIHCGDLGQIEIRDLESTNGTWLNGDRVTSATLDCPTRIRLGSIEILIDSLRT
jgi:FHA domain-containing protein